MIYVESYREREGERAYKQIDEVLEWHQLGVGLGLGSDSSDVLPVN